MVKKADILLAVAIIVFSISFLLVTYMFSLDGSTVTVTVDNEVYKTYALNKDITETIKTKYGVNVICISNGKVSIASADCPDKYCVSHVQISENGQTIVCLPHRLVVEVEGD